MLACRNESRGLAAEKKLNAALCGSPGAGRAEFIQLDLSDLNR